MAKCIYTIATCKLINYCHPSKVSNIASMDKHKFAQKNYKYYTNAISTKSVMIPPSATPPTTTSWLPLTTAARGRYRAARV